MAMAACDVYRPAAVDQLRTLGERIGVDVYERGTDEDPVKIASWALDEAKRAGKDVLIVDTAGRLHVDADADGRARPDPQGVKPTQILLVVDAMTGQDAVNVAEQFAEAVAVRRRRHDASSTATPAAARRCRSRRSRASRSCSPAPARSSTSSSASTPTAWRSGSSAWATS